MQVREQFSVAAEPTTVAAMLLDVDAVASCVPGVEGVRQTDDGIYTATLAIRVGPIKARFVGELALDGDEAPECLRARGKGKDRSTNSSVNVDMEAQLTETSQGTDVAVVADVAIRGRLGQFGTGVVQNTASEMTKSFAACLQSTLAPEPPGSRVGETSESVGASASPAGAPDRSRSVGAGAPVSKPPSLLWALVKGLWGAIRQWIGRLFGRSQRYDKSSSKRQR